MTRPSRARPIFWGAFVLYACTLDQRTLKPPLSCEGDGCIDFDVAGEGGGGGTGGGAARGAGGHGGEIEFTAGYSSEDGGEAGSLTGPDASCPDLDQNTILDCDETLAKNPTFDRDVNGWTPEADGAIAWNEFDWKASLDSGSITVKNRAKGASSGDAPHTAAKQCIRIADNRTYDVYAQMYLRGPTQTAYGAVSGRVFAADDCTGAALDIQSSLNLNTVDQWLTLKTTLPAAAGVHSLLVELMVTKAPSTPGEVSVQFDNVLVR